jgi:hypothetical protein
VDDSNGTGDTTLGDFTAGGSSDVPDQNVTASSVAGINVTDSLDSRYYYTFTGSDGSSGNIYFLATNGVANYGPLIISNTPLDPLVTYTFGVFNRNGEVSYSSVVACFTRGTLIETQSGPVPIEAITTGDLVLTMDRELRPVRWIGSKKVDAANLIADAKLRPGRFVAGALGSGLPKRDMRVSRQHRMVVSSKIADRMCNGDVLVSAIKLTELPGIFVDDAVEEVEYFHMLFDEHEVVFAEGAPSESLYTGPEALKAVSLEARTEILKLFPELGFMKYVSKPARPIPSLKRQKKIVSRHIANKKPILGKSWI